MLEPVLDVQEEEPLYFTSVVVLRDIMSTRKLYYLACRNKDCRYKGLSLVEGEGYICERCKKSRSDPVPRYSFRVKFADLTGSIEATVFGNQLGKFFTGMEIEEIVQLSQDLNDPKTYRELREKMHQGFYRKFEVKFKASINPRDPSKSIQIMCESAVELDYVKEPKRILKELLKD